VRLEEGEEEESEVTQEENESRGAVDRSITFYSTGRYVTVDIDRY